MALAVWRAFKQSHLTLSAMATTHVISLALEEGPLAVPRQPLPPGLISSYAESCLVSANTEKLEYALHWGSKTEWVLLGSKPRP